MTNEELVPVSKILENNDLYIFLAEDDVDDQELLIEAFTSLDARMSVRTVNNGKKAVEFLNSLSTSSLPALIVLDYNLPEYDGAKVLEKLAQIERYKNTPKVVWSTSNSAFYKQLCLQLGAKDYYVKPNEIAGIKALAKEMLNLCKPSF